MRSGRLPKGRPEDLLAPAVEAGIVTAEERDLVEQAAAARLAAIEVDTFTEDELIGRAAEPEQARKPVAVGA